MHIKHVLWLWLLAMAPLDVHAQIAAYKKEKRAMLRARKKLSAWNLSARGGLTQFWGELNQRNFRTAGGASVSWVYFRTSALSLSLDYNYGQLGGRKKAFFNSRFENRYDSAELIQRWDVLHSRGKEEDYPFHLNLYAGTGLMLFSAEAYHLTTGGKVRFTNHPETSARNPLFRKWGTPEGSPGIRRTHERTIPVGAAFGYDLSRSWKVGADLRFYFVRTDKLDATSGYRLVNPEEADSYSNTPNDKFSYLSLNLSYRFLRRAKRP